MTNDRYYCTECNSFVDKDHRCEQWSNTVHIPGGAIDKIRRETREEYRSILETVVDQTRRECAEKARMFCKKQYITFVESDGSLSRINLCKFDIEALCVFVMGKEEDK